MKNTSKKLFVSVFALLFALVAVATTSFAWFTISGKARVDAFKLDITSGEGIEIQLVKIGKEPSDEGVPGESTGWKNVITTADLLSITGYTALELEHLTSVNAQEFFEIGEDPDNDGMYIDTIPYDIGASTAQLLQFELHFRANNAYKVHLTEASGVSSNEAIITPEWSTLDPDGEGPLKPVHPGSYSAYPGDAIRIGFVVEEDDYHIWAPTDDKSNVGKNLPYGYINSTPEDSTKDGAYEFFNDYMDSVNNNLGNDGTYLPDAPTKTYSEGVLFGTGIGDDKVEERSLLTLSKITPTEHIAGPFTYYGKMTVRIWLEGWDGDCYNVLYATNLTTTLAFEGKED